MTTDVRTNTGNRVRMDPMRKAAFFGGGLYLITFLASIPALALKSPVLDHVDFILGHGSTTSVMWAGVLDLVTGLAGIGTAVALYPVTRRFGQSAAIGFLASRVLEASIIFMGVVSLLAIVTLRHDVTGTTGADAASLVIAGRSLVAVHNWTFLVGPGLVAGVNGLFLASVMFRSRLVPRIIPIVGLIGAPLIIISATGTIFGLWDQVSRAAVPLGFPIALWEFSLGTWMLVKGFKTVGTTLPPTAAPELELALALASV
jgi:hypothetical protein